MQVTETDPIEVLVGDSPAAVFPGGANWPEAFHSCPLPCALEGEVTVKVRVQHLEAAITLRGKCIQVCVHVCVCVCGATMIGFDRMCMCAFPDGEAESWWLSEVGQTFVPLTAATSSVLESELSSCKELLEVEPENKCK